MMIIGAGVIGVIALSKLFSGAVDGGAASGSIGGGDEFSDEMLAQQGFDIDPNTAYDPASGTEAPAVDSGDEYYDRELVPNQNEPAEEQPKKPITSDPGLWNIYANPIQPIYDVQGEEIGYYDHQNKQSVFNMPSITPEKTSTGMLGSGISPSQLGLGVLGFTGSYFTEFGEAMAKRTGRSAIGESAEAIAKRSGRSIVTESYEQGIKNIPFFGKKIFGDESAEAIAKKATRSLGGDVIEKAGKLSLRRVGKTVGGEAIESGLKGFFKRIGKYGIAWIPFIGTVAGSEFDVSVDGRTRPQAYTANIIGDVVGGLMGALGIVASPFGAAAIGVGGQVAGEQAAYAAFDYGGAAIEKVRSVVGRTVKRDYSMLPSASAMKISEITGKQTVLSKQAPVWNIPEISPSSKIIDHTIFTSPDPLPQSIAPASYSSTPSKALVSQAVDSTVFRSPDPLPQSIAPAYSSSGSSRSSGSSKAPVVYPSPYAYGQSTTTPVSQAINPNILPNLQPQSIAPVFTAPKTSSSSSSSKSSSSKSSSSRTPSKPKTSPSSKWTGTRLGKGVTVKSYKQSSHKPK